jgi:hypothetical protein
MAAVTNIREFAVVEGRVTALEIGHIENKKDIDRISDTVFGNDKSGGLITAVQVNNSKVEALTDKLDIMVVTLTDKMDRQAKITDRQTDATWGVVAAVIVTVIGFVLNAVFTGSP